MQQDGFLLLGAVSAVHISNLDRILTFTQFQSVSGFDLADWYGNCLGACISYTAFRAQRRMSATSFLVVVNLNKACTNTYNNTIHHPPEAKFAKIFGEI